jgi:hypothetical protein
VVRLAGAGAAGGDLLLAANLTADRRALLAATPARAAPLRAGLFPVAVSLDGRRFAAPPRARVVRARRPKPAMFRAKRALLVSDDRSGGLCARVSVRAVRAKTNEHDNQTSVDHSALSWPRKRTCARQHAAPRAPRVPSCGRGRGAARAASR